MKSKSRAVLFPASHIWRIRHESGMAMRSLDSPEWRTVVVATMMLSRSEIALSLGPYVVDEDPA